MIVGIELFESNAQHSLDFCVTLYIDKINNKINKIKQIKEIKRNEINKINKKK
jgi:hypothetical protein